jgi:hypothetical protein
MASMIRPRPMLPRPIKSPKKRSGLKRVSDKMRHSLRIYAALKKAWFLAHPKCQFVLTPGASCGEIEGVDVHHARGRGKYLNDIRTWVTLCRRHHSYVHDHPAYSYKHKYLLLRWK